MFKLAILALLATCTSAIQTKVHSSAAIANKTKAKTSNIRAQLYSKAKQLAQAQAHAKTKTKSHAKSKLFSKQDGENCEDVCEGHDFDADTCGAIQGCSFDEGQCWSAVGPGPCDGSGEVEWGEDGEWEDYDDVWDEDDMDMPEGEDLYAWFDVDSDGKVTEEEFFSRLMEICVAYEYEPTPEDEEEAKALFAKADADGDGGVTLEEAGAVAEEFEDFLHGE